MCVEHWHEPISYNVNTLVHLTAFTIQLFYIKRHGHLRRVLWSCLSRCRLNAIQVRCGRMNRKVSTPTRSRDLLYAVSLVRFGDVRGLKIPDTEP